MSTMNMLVTVALALIASAGFWATMQLVITRKGRTAEAARVVAETERIRQDSATGEIAKYKLISEVEAAAEARADAAADRRYAHLYDDYNEVKKKCQEQREALVSLVDVLDTLVFRMRGAPDSNDRISLSVSNDEFLTARATLNEARTHLR